MSRAVMIAARDAAAGYSPGAATISELEFEVEAGTLVSVLGPNGAGKSTLFRALLGELPEVRGTLTVAGEIAYVPQTERSRLDFPIDARGVVEMGASADLSWYRRSGRAEREACDEALARVGLEALASTRYGELSGGQRQRVLVARALARQAPIICLDEPLSGIDQPSTERLLALFEELRDEGRALLVSTHDLAQAGASDRVLCLNRRQVAFGDPAATLTDAVVRETYGGELVILPGGGQAVVTDHHHHDGNHSHGGGGGAVPQSDR